MRKPTTIVIAKRKSDGIKLLDQDGDFMYGAQTQEAIQAFIDGFNSGAGIESEFSEEIKIVMEGNYEKDKN